MAKYYCKHKVAVGSGAVCTQCEDERQRSLLKKKQPKPAPKPAPKQKKQPAKKQTPAKRPPRPPVQTGTSSRPEPLEKQRHDGPFRRQGNKVARPEERGDGRVRGGDFDEVD